MAVIRGWSALASSVWAVSPAFVAIILLGIADPVSGTRLTTLVASVLLAALAVLVISVCVITRWVARAAAGPAFSDVRTAVPRISDPDADGHVRPRAPGSAPVR